MKKVVFPAFIGLLCAAICHGFWSMIFPGTQIFIQGFLSGAWSVLGFQIAYKIINDEH